MSAAVPDLIFPDDEQTQEQEHDTAMWLATLGHRMETVRWLFYVVGVLGLVLAGCGVCSGTIFWILNEASYYNLSIQHPWLAILPGVGLLLSLVGSTGFGLLSVGARLCLKDASFEATGPSSRLSFLTRARLCRWGFWAAFLSLAAAAGFVASGAVVITGGVSSLPAIRWAAWAARRALGAEVVMMALSIPLVAGYCGSALIGGAFLGPKGRRPLREVPMTQEALASLPSPPEPGDQGPILRVIASPTSCEHLLCPVCGVAVGRDPMKCRLCRTPHHRDCWEYAGGCAIFGCSPRHRRAPVAPEALTTLEHAVDRWVTFARLQWGGLCLAVLGVVMALWGAVLPINGLVGASLLQCAAAMAGLVLVCGAALGVVGLVTTMLFDVLHEVYGRSLRARLDLVRTPSSIPCREVVDRLDAAASGDWLQRFLAIVPATTVSLALVIAPAIYLFPAGWHCGRTPAEVWGFLALAFMFPLALYKASRVRLGLLRSLQNRMAATLKKGGS